MAEHGRSHWGHVLAIAGLILLGLSAPAWGEMEPPAAASFANPLQIPDTRAILPAATEPEGISATIQILVLLTVLTLVPSILVLMTCFTRILIVLALLRQALATPQLPPGQVLMGLSLFMTILVMAPTWDKVNQQALKPYLDGQLTQEEALDRALAPMRDYMYGQIETAENFEDIYLFLEYQQQRPIDVNEQVTLDEVPSTVLIPAYVLSELKVAFVMGFRIYLPFLVIDMVIASILISMGMMMLPPVLISLPFKILLFVLADGWHLVVQTLLASFVT